MTQFNEELIPHPFKYGAMPLERRKEVLPERSVCSLYPADNWDDAFVTGDGFQRLDVLGDPYNDCIAYTQEALYEPLWAKTHEPPDLSGILPTVRKLMLNNKFKDAAELIEKAQIDAGLGPYLSTSEALGVPATFPLPSLSRHSAFRLAITQPECSETVNYLRFLDLMTGCVTVQWENSLGRFKREAFVAYQGNVNAVRFISNEPGALNVRLGILLPDCDFSGGYGIGLNAPERCAHQLKITGDLITLELAYCPEFGQKGYCSVLRMIRQGGTVTADEKGLQVNGADSLLVLSKTVKFEDAFEFGCSKAVADELMSLSDDFDALTAYNRAHIGSRMERSRIVLGDREDFALSSEELLRRTHSVLEFDPTLFEKLYDMGRFFQITDTGNIPPMWGQHNINTNLQVCAGNNTGLFDEMDVYYRYYESKFDDFRINAKKLFGARGLLASVHCDYDSGLLYHSSKTYPHYFFTGCLGWIYNELWGYYLITGDKDFLKHRIVPALKEIALFYEDYACDRGPDGHVLFYPSFSPENPTPNYATDSGVYAASINSLMDIMICREVLDNLLEACDTLGMEQENIAHWKKQRSLLPRYLLDEEGGLKEWAWPSVNENYNHRHVSHHYDVWPGHYITWEDQPELAQAIRISNRKRGQQDDSAHGIIHRLFTAIRLKDINETVQNLYQLMNHGFVTRTLTTYHYPYRLHCPDLLGAMPAILLEMCVYSAPGTIELLPAMPSSLGKGHIEGIWLYTCAKLTYMDWSEKEMKAELVSNKAQVLTLRCRRNVKAFLVNGIDIPMTGDHITYATEKDETIKIEIILC